VALIVLGSYLVRNYRPIVVVAVPYIAVNIYNYSGPVVSVTNNLTGLIFSRVGHRDLGICFSNKPGP
jgi:hypothetical protein